MINTFKIDGFKSLSNSTVEFGLVNVFIGANGSGKSNLLEALGVIGAAAFGSVEPETLRYRGVRPGLPSLYKSSFRRKAFRRFITLETRSEHSMYRIGIDNPISSPNIRWKIRTETLEQYGTRLVSRSPRGCNIYNLFGDTQKINQPDDQSAAKLGLATFASTDHPARDLVSLLEDYAIFSPTTPILRGIASDLQREPLGLGGSGLPLVIRELINRSEGTFGSFDLEEVWELIEWAQNMSATPSIQALMSPSVRTSPIVIRFVDRFMRPERNRLSAYDASEGALYVLFMLALVCHPKTPRLFAVDNFDQALHPRLACKLTSMICEQIVSEGARQMLATTHNPLVLDGLNLLDDRIRLFAVDRDAKGVTQINRIVVTEELMTQADKGLSLSRLWLMGRLGGVPKSL